MRRPRPPSPTLGYQDWRELLFLHWPVSPAVLRPLIPAPLTLDLFREVAYVSLVPFVIRSARPIGLPAAFGVDFQETNVRTYVRARGEDPGIYMFSLDAGSRAAVLGARLAYGLPYYFADTWLRRDRDGVDYALRRRAGTQPRLRVRYRPGEVLGVPAPGTLDHFLIERYRLHVKRGPTLWTLPVRHAPYVLQRAHVLALESQLIGTVGIATLGEVSLAHYVAGVNVSLLPPRVTV